jgi:hypothetical protein
MTSNSQPQSSSLDNYRDMLRERGELADFKKQCEDRIKQLDEDLRPVLEGRGEIVAEGYSFKCALSKGRKSIDKELLEDHLKKQGLSVSDFEKEGSPFTTFTVKKVNQL